MGGVMNVPAATTSIPQSVSEINNDALTAPTPRLECAQPHNHDPSGIEELQDRVVLTHLPQHGEPRASANNWTGIASVESLVK